MQMNSGFNSYLAIKGSGPIEPGFWNVRATSKHAHWFLPISPMPSPLGVFKREL